VSTTKLDASKFSPFTFAYTNSHTTPVIRLKHRSDIRAKKAIEWHTSVTWTDIRAELNQGFVISRDFLMSSEDEEFAGASQTANIR